MIKLIILLILIAAALFICFRHRGYIPIVIKIAGLSAVMLVSAIFMIKNSLADTLSRNFRNDIYSIMLSDISSLEYDIQECIENNDTEKLNMLMQANMLSYRFSENTDNPVNPVLLNTSIDSVEYYSMLYPLDSAVIEVSMEKSIADSRVSDSVNFIIFIISAVFTLLCAVFLTTLYFLLRPVRKKVSDSSVFKDEVKDIRNVFENMMENISEYQKNMLENNETYHKFLPSAMFSVFDKNNISELKAGDTRKVPFYNMYLDLSRISDKDYSALISEEYITETIRMNYMEISFRHQPQEALKYISRFCYAGISFGTSFMTITGGKNRLQPLIISEHKKIAEILAAIAKKYNRNLIISEYALRNFNDRSCFRCIGHICFNGQYIKIYDINDNSYTYDDFSKGIDCFIQKDFYNAEIFFANVLKYNKNDDIAKEYLSMSELYLSGSQNPETDILSYSKEC